MDDLNLEKARCAAPPPQLCSGDPKGDQLAGFPGTKEADRASAAKTIPYYFAAIAGLIYAVGFLVEFTFMNSIGVKDSLTEAFKAKHIYIGCLCLQFPVSAIIVVLLASRLKRVIEKNGSEVERKKVKAYLPGTLLMMTLLFAFYVLIGFARPNTFSNHRAAIACFFGLTILGIFSIAELQRRTTESGDVRIEEILRALGITPAFWIMARWCLLIISVVFLLYIILDLLPLLWDMLVEGGYLYFGVLALAGFWIWRFDARTDEIKLVRPEMLMPAGIISITIVSALLFLAVIFFAVRVYCYIPVFKGGGDFTTESASIFRFDQKLTNSISAEILDGGVPCSSKPVMLLQQNGAFFYVTMTNATSNPTTWRKLGREFKPKRIYAIRREAVVETSYLYQKE